MTSLRNVLLPLTSMSFLWNKAFAGKAQVLLYRHSELDRVSARSARHVAVRGRRGLAMPYISKTFLISISSLKLLDPSVLIAYLQWSFRLFRVERSLTEVECNEQMYWKLKLKLNTRNSLRLLNRWPTRLIRPQAGIRKWLPVQIADRVGLERLMFWKHLNLKGVCSSLLS